MHAPLVVFDLDGTLVDTAPDLIGTLNTVLAPEGIPPVALDAARRLVGAGARVMIQRAFAAHQRVCDETNLERLFQAFIAHYSDHIAEQSRPFPGAIEAMDHLESRGWRFAICTNKLEGLARRLLGALGIDGRFPVICGQDTFGVPKPDPTPLLRTISAAGADRAAAVMVGDTTTDIRTARAARIPVIAVDFGYSDVPPAQLGADHTISSFAELAAAAHAMLRRDETAASG
ncbi:MAG TPA: phosphoglycolate phosphatase [Pseudolabrys sp.]|nr:phosphoglycolate phosphatase [Pseudolabrys sp.]